MNEWNVASVSWGKDSLAMLIGLIECGRNVDEVVFYDTGAEFNAIYDTRDKFLPILRQERIEYTELRPKEPFFYSMLARPVRSRETGEVHKRGYGWCGGACRWGTSAKNAAIERHCREVGATRVYVGLAHDEKGRIARNTDQTKEYPLDEWGYTEAECLEMCRRRGFDWIECGISLYDVLDRVSCWCCRNKNLKELRAIHDHLPKYWERLVALEEVNGQMKPRHTLAEIGKRQ